MGTDISEAGLDESDSDDVCAQGGETNGEGSEDGPWTSIEFL